MKAKHLTLSLVMAGLLISAFSIQARGWGDNHWNNGQHLDRVGDWLDLDEEQRRRYAVFLEAKRASFAARREARESFQQTAKDFWSREDISAEDINSFYQQHQAYMQHNPEVNRALADFHASLNAEQRESFAAMMGKRGMMGDSKRSYHKRDSFDTSDSSHSQGKQSR